MVVVIETMSREHWPDVRAIYQEGIATGNATVDTEAPEWDTWDNDHLTECRLVAKEAHLVVGWVAVSPTSHRAVYSGVVDESIYVAAMARGKGVGRALLMALVAESERRGIWSLQAGIFPENLPSLALHLACGFRQIGFQERKGLLNGVWRDVVLMERRSKLVCN